MFIYYRISNNSHSFKVKLPNATKEHCLENFLNEFDKPDNDITIMADNLTEKSLYDFAMSKTKANIKVEHTKLGNAPSLIYCIESACRRMADNDFFYLCEDDYLYLPNACEVLKEGLTIADYATLYDHPDKYINAVDGGNPQIEGGGEVTRVVLTKSSHWKLTNSTTGTFGAKASILKQDLPMWQKYFSPFVCNDYAACCELTQERGRSLISCIPAKSTHAENQWLSPLIDWTTV
jgi:hypothetical protein